MGILATIIVTFLSTAHEGIASVSTRVFAGEELSHEPSDLLLHHAGVHLLSVLFLELFAPLGHVLAELFHLGAEGFLVEFLSFLGHLLFHELLELSTTAESGLVSFLLRSCATTTSKLASAAAHATEAVTSLPRLLLL